MKKIWLFVAGACSLFGSSMGQQQETHVNDMGQVITVSTPVDFQVTPPAREWDRVAYTDLEHEVRAPKRRSHQIVNPQALPAGIDPALQQERASRTSGPPIQNWEGLQGVTPPDPSGAAGPNHYVQAVNISYAVYDKTGNMTAGPFALSSLWNNTIDEGDPIVMYDRHADRWFISQFQDSPARMLLAVSQTPDPTGSYYAYSFQMADFPDYPKFSIWWDGYYMTANASQTTVVFERDKMLTGDPSARMIALTNANPFNNGFVSILPADADGSLPPNGTPCYFFHLEDDAWGAPSDRIIIHTMSTDWVNTGNTQLTQSQTLSPQAFDTDILNISQPGTGSTLDGVPEVFYYRAPYLRFTNHNSVLLSHVVDVNGNGRAGMRWYELRDPGTGTWSIHQEGTYSPDANNRWMGSIGMDNQGNIAMAYSITGSDGGNVFPGLRYTGRFANDPLGSMTMAEETAVNGNGTFSGFRYGDYAQLALDPDGQTFWFTGEYMEGTEASTTRIFSFQIATAAATEGPYQDLDMKIYRQGEEAKVEVQGLPSQEAVQLDLIALNGQVLEHHPLTPHQTTLQHTFDLGTYADGIYFIRLGNQNFQRVERIIISK